MKTSDIRYQLASYRGTIAGFASLLECDIWDCYRRPSNRICWFFWQMVLGMFLIVVDAVVLSTALVGTLDILDKIFTGEFNFDLLTYIQGVFPDNKFFFALMIVGVLVSIGSMLLVAIVVSIALYAGVTSVAKWVISKLPEREYQVKEPKEDSVVWAYIKARKEKFCPTLTFED